MHACYLHAGQRAVYKGRIAPLDSGCFNPTLEFSLMIMKENRDIGIGRFKDLLLLQKRYTNKVFKESKMQWN
jgi:hypothetical protein